MRAAAAKCLRRFETPVNVYPAFGFSGQRHILPQACAPAFIEGRQDIVDLHARRDAAVRELG